MKFKGKSFNPVLVIAVTFAVGYLAFKLSGIKDSPLEQAAEAVLRHHGIEIDFSAGKK